jgi:hypothetical protein
MDSEYIHDLWITVIRFCQRLFSLEDKKYHRMEFGEMNYFLKKIKFSYFGQSLFKYLI